VYLPPCTVVCPSVAELLMSFVREKAYHCSRLNIRMLGILCCTIELFRVVIAISTCRFCERIKTTIAFSYFGLSIFVPRNAKIVNVIPFLFYALKVCQDMQWFWLIVNLCSYDSCFVDISKACIKAVAKNVRP